MGLQFDTTINLGNIAMMGAALWGIGWQLIRQRDFNRDVLQIIGKGRPPGDRFGVLGDIEALKDRHGEDHEKLNEVRTALGFNRRGNDPIPPSGRAQ